MTGRSSCRRSAKVAGVVLATAALVLLGASAEGDDRILLIPHLQNGDSFHYESHAKLNRVVKTESNVVSMFDAAPLHVDFSTNLMLSVQDFHSLDHRPMMAAETQMTPEESPGPASGKAASQVSKVSFALGGDGALMKADGLDDLDPTQRLTWQFWLSQFAFGWTLPSAGVKVGEKWKSEEAEKTPTPIAKLVWERETTYVQDQACPVLAKEQCAVFLISATLKQKSNPENATPEDYQLHQLKTLGTAQGTNETVLYISRTTGLLIRASEDVQQSLDVTIAKADGSNQVKYRIDVSSHFETLFVPQESLATTKK
jgi:hypothetical protein